MRRRLELFAYGALAAAASWLCFELGRRLERECHELDAAGERLARAGQAVPPRPVARSQAGEPPWPHGPGFRLGVAS